MDLRSFALEMVKEAKAQSLALKAGKKIYKGMRWLVTAPTKVKPHKIQAAAKDVRAYARGMAPETKELVSRIAKGEKGVVKDPVKFLKGLVKKHDLRDIEPMKPLLLGAVPVGIYRGVSKGRAKLETPKYYGRIKSPHLYQHPAQRLY
jgi:hypothetical protein